MKNDPIKSLYHHSLKYSKCIASTLLSWLLTQSDSQTVGDSGMNHLAMTKIVCNRSRQPLNSMCIYLISFPLDSGEHLCPSFKEFLRRGVQNCSMDRWMDNWEPLTPNPRPSQCRAIKKKNNRAGHKTVQQT